MNGLSDVTVAEAMIKRNKEKQLMKACEELSELAAECARAASSGNFDKKAISSEMADVRFCMLQLMLMPDNKDAFSKMVQNAYDYKVKRTAELYEVCPEGAEIDDCK